MIRLGNRKKRNSFTCQTLPFFKKILAKIKVLKDQNLIYVSIIYKSLASRANDSATSPDRPMKLRANVVKLLSSS